MAGALVFGLAPAIALPLSGCDTKRGTGGTGMNTKKPDVSEVLQMCQTAEKLITAIFIGREEKKGIGINGWPKRLLRKISESI
jgi:hypothetical protein